MKSMDDQFSSLKYLTPKNLYDHLTKFTSGMSVTKGSFELEVQKCTLEDIEWNHMDQLHRLSIHNTYEKSVRIASGRNFAVSLTQWGNWPFFITVSDVYVAKGLFYQSLVIAGIVFLHSIISVEKMDNERVKLKDEWYIASHKLFKFLHWPLNKKLYKLNERLQQEDEQVRQGRFELRKKGYSFRTDVPDYYNSNILGTNTLYPHLGDRAWLNIDEVSDLPQVKRIGDLEFVVKKNQDTYLIWPAACPHEGGPLINGNFCDNKVACPWHGLQFRAAELSNKTPLVSRQGFEYQLSEGVIKVKQLMREEAHRCLENMEMS